MYKILADFAPMVRPACPPRGLEKAPSLQAALALGLNQQSHRWRQDGQEGLLRTEILNIVNLRPCNPRPWIPHPPRAAPRRLTRLRWRRAGCRTSLVEMFCLIDKVRPASIPLADLRPPARARAPGR